MKKLLLILLFISFVSCSKDDDVSITSDELEIYQLDLISYFKSIALGFEFGGVTEITRRWETDLNIFVGGSPSDDLLIELENIKDEINDLATTNFVINVVNDSLISNYYIFFGARQQYSDIFPEQADYVENNFGLFSVFWNGLNQINNGYMSVDTERANPQEPTHLLREDFNQSLGLSKDSYLYNNSIFQQNWTATTQYSQIDKDLIRLLYHSKMEIGLNSTQVEKRLTDILLKE